MALPANSLLSTSYDLQMASISADYTVGVEYIDLSGKTDVYDTNYTGGLTFGGVTAAHGARILNYVKLNHTIKYRIQRQSSLFDKSKRIMITRDGNPAFIVQNGQNWAWSPSSAIVDHWLNTVLIGVAPDSGMGLNAGTDIKEADVIYNAADYRSADYQAVQALVTLVEQIFSAPVGSNLQRLREMEINAIEKSERQRAREKQFELERKAREKGLHHNSLILTQFGNQSNKLHQGVEDGALSENDLHQELIIASQSASKDIQELNA